MTRDEMVAYIRAACDKMIATMERKQHDYTSGDDPFENFKAVEALGVCDAETGIIVRRIDKLKRTISFIKKGVLKVTDETVEDTLLDDACYSLLLAALIHSRRAKAATPIGQGQNEWKLKGRSIVGGFFELTLTYVNDAWILDTHANLRLHDADLERLKADAKERFGVLEGWPT